MRKVTFEIDPLAIQIRKVIHRQQVATGQGRYRIIKSVRDSTGRSFSWDVVLRTNLSLARAKKLEQKLERACQRKYSRQTSWTRPVFYFELEPYRE